MAITAAQVIDRTLQKLIESTTVPVRYTRIEVLNWLNEGMAELNLISGQVQSSETISWSTSTNIHNLASTSIGAISVYYNGKSIRKESVEGLDRIVDWEKSGKTGNRPLLWVPLGLTKIIIYPRAASSGGSLTVHVLYHTSLTDSATAISLPDYHIASLEDYCFHRSRFKEGGAEFIQSIDDYKRFEESAEVLAGHAIWKREPAFSYAPKTKTAEITAQDTK